VSNQEKMFAEGTKRCCSRTKYMSGLQ